MSEFGGLWKHGNTQHALVPPKTECGCPSGGGIKNGHTRYPSYGGTQKKPKKTTTIQNRDECKRSRKQIKTHRRLKHERQMPFLDNDETKQCANVWHTNYC